MKCPLCPEELIIVREGFHPNNPDIKCPATLDPNLSYYDTHYQKHPVADWGYHGTQEDMIIYPYLIINHDIVRSDIIEHGERMAGGKSVYVSIKKYNPNRMTSGVIKELRPGFERVLTFPGYIHPDTEDNLRARLKLLLLLS